MQGEFTKEEADIIKEAVDEMFTAIPKSKRLNFIGHLNEILIFIEAAKKAAPTEEERRQQQSTHRGG